MRICSNEPCIVLLTEKDTWLRVNGKEPISLKANYMAILACENNVIDISSLNSVLVIQVSRNNIKDYLQFLNKDLSHLPVWQRNADPLLTANCLTPDIFRAPPATARWKHRMKLLVNVPVRSFSPFYPAFLTTKNLFLC